MRDSSFQSTGTYGATQDGVVSGLSGLTMESSGTPVASPSVSPRTSASGSSAGSPSVSSPPGSILPLAKVTVSFQKENRDVPAKFFLYHSRGFFEIFFESEAVPCITFQVKENQNTIDVVVPSQDVQIEEHSELLESRLLESDRVQAIAENVESQVPALFLISQIVAAFLFELLKHYEVSLSVREECNIMNVSNRENIRLHLAASLLNPIFTATTLNNVRLKPEELSAIILDGKGAPQVTSPQASASSPEIGSSPYSQSSPDYSDRF